MSILLVNPPTPDYMPNKEFILPTSLLSLAAVLRKAGYSVSILDLNIYHPWEIPADQRSGYLKTLLEEEISKHDPSLAGIGCLFSGQFDSVMALAAQIKELSPGVPVVIGGMHPTIYPQEILANCPEIDYVVIGEGERQLVALAGQIINGAPFPEELDGIAWREKGSVMHRPKKSFIENLDELPMPAYDLLDLPRYDHDTSKWHNPKRLPFNRTVPIISSRSCPCKCSFCSMLLVMGPKIRFHSPIRIADELDLLYREYGQTHFSFMDDNINLNRNHILAICNEIRRRKLEIQFETPNGLSVAPLDREVMDSMVAAGWVRGAIAIESGSDYIRNEVMGKRLAREKIHEVARLARSYKQLYLKAYFIIGMPEETRETIQETYDMVEELGLAETYVTNLLPFPGTRVFAQAMQDKLLVDDINIQDLWRTTGFHYTDNKRFYLKPYKMDLDELAHWRDKFDSLLFDMKERWKTEHRNGS
jgi:radical SAM superfamily enzyme YgiQ (UPF0313 family)